MAITLLRNFTWSEKKKREIKTLKFRENFGAELCKITAKYLSIKKSIFKLEHV